MNTAPETIIAAAVKKQHQAKRFLRRRQYEEATVLLEDVLCTKMKYVDVKPFVCIIDIAEISFALGSAYKALNESTNRKGYNYEHQSKAKKYLHLAWKLYREEFGDNHPLTEEAHRQCIVATYSSSSLTTHASAAAA